MIASKRSVMTSARMPAKLGQIMPPKCITKLPYVDLQQFDTGNTLENQVYMINGMHDPNISGLSGASLTQPRGYDQLAKFYRRYVVNAAKITCTVHNGGTFAVKNNLILSAGSSPIQGAIHKDCEQPYSTTVTCAASGSGPTVRKMSQYVKMSTIYGDAEYDASDYGALVTANPDKQVFAAVATGGFFVGSGGDKIVQISTEIVFYCTFYDLRPLVASTGADD